MAYRQTTLNSEFNKYFNNNVQLCRDDKKKAYSIAMPIIEKLVRKVNEKDPRFGPDFVKVGSSFQGLKTGEPNEYDINIPLNGISQYVWATYMYSPRKYDISPRGDEKQHGIGPSLPPNYHLYQHLRVEEITLYTTSTEQAHPPNGHTYLPLNSNLPMWINSEDLTFAGDLIPILIKKHLKKLIIEAVRELDLRGQVTVDRNFHGPAITIQISHRSLSFEISVDISPVINKSLTHHKDSWPHSGTSWPTENVKDRISLIGISHVAKKDLLWVESSALAERELMKNIDQPGECRRKAHRIMKKLNEDLWCNSSRKVISSYALKNILFWECEKYSQTEHWTDERLDERIISMTKYLYKCVNEINIPKYFRQNFNMLQNKDDNEKEELKIAARKIKAFLDEPIKTMQNVNIS